LEHFHSAIQLLAVFNIALITSNHYLESLNIVLTGYLDDCKEHIKASKQKIDESLSFINQSLDNSDNLLPRDINKLEDDKTSLNDTFLQSHKQLEVRLNKKVKDVSVSSGFQAFCFYSSFICLVSLISPGVSKVINLSIKATDFWNEVFIIFLVISFGLMFLVVNKSWPKQSFMGVIIISILSLISSIIIVIILDFALNLSCPIELEPVLIFLVLFICSSHFLYYFVKALFFNKKNSIKIYEDIMSFDNEIKNKKLAIAAIVGHVNGTPNDLTVAEEDTL